MRSLALEPQHEELGASFASLAGWRVPADYGDALAEQRAARSGAGLIDLSAAAKARVTGPDRRTFLDGVLTNDVKTLGQGRGLYAVTLDHKGRVHGDLVAYHDGDAYTLAMEPEAGPAVLAHMSGLLVSDDVTIEDVTDAWAILGVFGARSRPILETLFRVPPPLDAYAFVAARREGAPVRLARSPQFGEEGFEVWVPPGSAAALFRDVVAAGARPFGARAADALRIEAGRPRYPQDMNEETLAVEIGLGEAISGTKGCYVGQEVVSRATHVGHPNRRLVGLALDGGAPPTLRAPVSADGLVVGSVTSAAWSAALERAVALAIVRREHAAPGTPVAVNGARARVATLPFV